MSADDHTMTILTGAVLALGLGASVQNSSWLMDQFAPKVYDGAVSDAFVMRAGHAQKLDVLSNDDFKAGSDFRVVSAPSCGTATVVGDRISFIAASDCSGDVSFTYCVDANGTCEPAEVALNIRGNESEEALSVAQVEPQPVVRKTRIKRIKRNKPAENTSTVAVADDRPVADASKPYLPQEQSPAQARLAPKDEETPRLAQASGVVAPPLLTPAFNEGDTRVGATIDTSQPLLSFNAVTDVVALTDAMNTTTKSQLGLASRSDTRLRGDCDVQLSTQVMTGGIIHLSVQAPCYAGAVGRVQHAGLVFDLSANEWGMAELDIPAFSQEAELLVTFDTTETAARIVQSVPEMSRLRRVALVWNGETELDLHAFEFGANEGSRGHVNPVNRRDYHTAIKAAGGYLDRVEVREGTHADIYTLPGGKSAPGGAISLAVSARAQSCGDSVSFMTLHSVPGEATTSRAYELSAEACQLLSVVKPDQNLVPEITLAANTR